MNFDSFLLKAYPKLPTDDANIDRAVIMAKPIAWSIMILFETILIKHQRSVKRMY